MENEYIGVIIGLTSVSFGVACFFLLRGTERVNPPFSVPTRFLFSCFFSILSFGVMAGLAERSFLKQKESEQASLATIISSESFKNTGLYLVFLETEENQRAFTFFDRDMEVGQKVEVNIRLFATDRNLVKDSFLVKD